MIRGNEDLNLPNEWVNCIDSSAREYCKKVFSTLSEYGYSDAFTNLVFLGGGAGIIKKFCEDSHNFVFITDVHANAKGYEDFYSMDINVSFGKDLTSPTAPHDYILIDIYLNNQKSMGVLVS